MEFCRSLFLQHGFFCYDKISFQSYFHPRHVFRFARIVDGCLTLCLRGLMVVVFYYVMLSFHSGQNPCW